MLRRLVSLTALLALVPACAEPDRGPYAGRNVCLIVIDALRADRLPVYGCPKPTAPFLTELAERSVVFDRAWSSSSWTAPATASIFTSLHPDQHGVRTGWYLHRNLVERGEFSRLNRVPGPVETLPELLKSLGYRTFGLADNPNVGEPLGFAAGFDRYVCTSYEGAEAFNARLSGWLDELRDGDDPWFLYLHYMDPHAPYHRREPWYSEEHVGHAEGFEEDLANYDSEIGYVDAALREVFEWLTLEEEAIVIVTSDHGEEFGDHGGREHPAKLYSELTRVPFLVRLPGEGAPRGRVLGNASTLDVLPTLRGLLGLPRSKVYEGRNLAPALLAPEARVVGKDRPVHAMRVRESEKRFLERRSLVRNRFKLIFSLPMRKAELYDLKADPQERSNLVEKRPDLLLRLVTELDDYNRRPRLFDREFAPVESPTDEQMDELERLGYVGDD